MLVYSFVCLCLGIYFLTMFYSLKLYEYLYLWRRLVTSDVFCFVDVILSKICWSASYDICKCVIWYTFGYIEVGYETFSEFFIIKTFTVALIDYIWLLFLKLLKTATTIDEIQIANFQWFWLVRTFLFISHYQVNV